MAKKSNRQKHTGTVYKDGKYWCAAMQVAGKRFRLRRRSRAEANQALGTLRERAAAAAKAMEDSTLGDFRRRWEKHVEANHARNTSDSYAYALEPFHELDTVPLSRLKAAPIQSIVDSLKGRKQQLCFDVMRRMLAAGVRWGTLESNPMDRLTRPRHTRKAIDPFEPEEVSAILRHLNGHRYFAAVSLTFACGLRGSEAWGLKWSDQSGKELTIQRQACETAGYIEIKKPRTQAGIRRILLPDSVVDALHEKRADVMREGFAGAEWMFPSSVGDTTRRSNFCHRVWNPTLKKLGIRNRGFHHARHTAATLLLNNGVPVTVVSRTLGHKDVSTTLSQYAHVMLGDLERHRNVFDTVIAAG